MLELSAVLRITPHPEAAWSLGICLVFGTEKRRKIVVFSSMMCVASL